MAHKVIKKVVYVGAAEGYHTAYLADMFSDFKFDLWDQREFDIKDRPNITLFNRLFLVFIVTNITNVTGLGVYSRAL